MKRCPTCRHLFPDSGFSFCRIDGARLTQEQLPVGDDPTVLFSTTQLSDRFPWLRRDSSDLDKQMCPDTR